MLTFLKTEHVRVEITMGEVGGGVLIGGDDDKPTKSDVQGETTR